MQPKFTFEPDDLNDPNKLDTACKSLLAALAIMLAVLVKRGDAQRLTALQQGVGEMFRNASTIHNGDQSTDSRDN